MASSAAPLVLKTSPSAAIPTSSPLEFFKVGGYELHLSDTLSLVSIVATALGIVVAACGIAFGAVIAIRQLRIMNRQTTLMDDTLKLASDEFTLLKEQMSMMQADAENAKKSAELYLTASGIHKMQHRPDEAYVEAYLGPKIHNVGTKSAKNWFITVGIPEPFFIDHEMFNRGWWQELDAVFKPLGYSFFSASVVGQIVFAKTFQSHESVELNVSANAPPCTLPIVYRIVYEDGASPADPLTFFEMTETPGPTTLRSFVDGPRQPPRRIMRQPRSRA